MKTLIQIFWLAALALIALLSRAAQPFTPLLVVDSVNTLVTRTPTTGESIVVLGQAAAYDSAPRIARNFPAGSYTVDGVDNFAAVNGTIWHLNWLSSGVSINGSTRGGIVDGTNVLWLASGSTNAQAYVVGYQTTNAALSALIANPAMYQATNVNLTAVAAGGTSSNYFRGDGSFAQVATNQIPGHDTHIANLQTAISARQPASSVLTNVAALTSGTSTNFLAGDGTFKQVTTNMIPGHNGDISNLQSAITARQVASAALTNLAGGDGSALTNVARIGLGQPEVSGVAFDGATAGTRVVSLSQALGTNDFTLWARFKVPANSSAFNRTIAAFTASATTALASTDWLIFFNASGQLIVQQYGSSVVNIRQKLISGFQTAYSGQIVDVVSVRTGTNCLVYVNGSLASTSDGTAGTPPGWDQSVGSTYFRLGSYADTGSGDTSGIFDSQIYRTAVFNRALSASDVQSLVKNGIDPSDQWGNSTVPVVSYSPSTLNGGFETNSLNAAGTWSTTVSGASTVTIDTTGTNSHSGNNSLKMFVDPTNNFAGISASNGSQFIPAGKRYRISWWAKRASGTGATPILVSYDNTSTSVSQITATTNWTQAVAETTVSSLSGIFIKRASANQGDTYFIDDVEVTQIGAILDLDFTTGGGTNVFDRSSNSLTATNYGGVSWTLPRKGEYIAGNATVASNLTVAGTITGTVAGYQTTNVQLTTLINNSGANLTNVAMRGLGQPEVSGLAYDGVTTTRTTGLNQALGTNDFSVWVRVKVPTTLGGSAYRWIWATSSNPSDASPANCVQVLVNSADLNFDMRGSPNSNERALVYAGWFTANAGKIVDLVFTRQGTNVVTYSDGVAITGTVATAGTPPSFADSITSTYFHVGLGASSQYAWNGSVYRATVFNRALSQADVTSLINNGIDPADEWGSSSVPVVSYSPSTLNGGFETNSLNTAGTWATFIAGASTATIDTSGTNARTGSNAGRMAVDPTNNFSVFYPNNGLSTFIGPGKRYRASLWMKKDASTSGSPTFKLDNSASTLFIAISGLTTNYQQFSTEITPTATSDLRLINNSAASSTNYVDDFELTRIGAILDLDFTTGYGTNVWDRSSNSLNATNYGGVSWTMPVVALNTGTIRATNLTATYISGDGSAITSTGATNQNQLVTLAQLESFTANGLHMFFYGSSNAAGINSGTAVHTNWAYSTASSSAAVTNTVASPTNSQYLCEFVSNDTFTQFASGVVNIEMWMFFNAGGGRAVSVLAEAYIYDSVGGTNYVELTPATAAQDLSGTLTKYLYSIPISDITPPNASRLVIKFKVGSVASTPTVSMVSQGVYTSHAAFSVPLSSYVLKTGDTMTGALALPSLTSTNFIDLKEGSSAGNPATNYARLLIVPSGAKQALIIKWSDGTTNTIATHP